MVCIVVTQNGRGDVYTFADKKAARLHPVAQAYDVFAADSSELANQYGKDEIELLMRFAEGRDKSRLVDAFEVWKSEPKSPSLPFEVRDLLWKLLVREAKEPPKEPAAILNVIEVDRRAMEGKIFRSRSEANPQVEQSTPARRNSMTDKVKKARINDAATIKILTDKNPKRGKSAERFALYKDGQTVKEAKEAGITAADITYDLGKEFISVTEPEAEAAAAE